VEESRTGSWSTAPLSASFIRCPLRRSSNTTIGRRRGSRAVVPPSASFIRRPLRRSSSTTIGRRHRSRATVPPSVKLQHNCREAVRIQGDDAPFGLLHPAPPTVKLRHNQATARIPGDDTPFGLEDPAVVGGREMQVARLVYAVRNPRGMRSGSVSPDTGYK
jgi:hypothetical protein